MKLKARDLVAGWPRGRSMSVLSISPGEKMLWFRFEHGLMDKFPLRYTPATRDRLQHIARVVDELIQEIDYRAEQQRMVNRYLERWRLDPDGCLLDLKMWPEDPLLVQALQQFLIHPIAGL